MTKQGGPRLRLTERARCSDYVGLESLDEQRVLQLLGRAWRIFEGPADALIEVVWMAQQEHSEIHARFLDDPSPTDVMAFPYGDEDLFGEILVNLDMAAEQAKERHSPIQAEVELYVVHGALHLLGFDDHDDDTRAAMRAAELRVLGG
ncbi:MAG: rRNA maturation RNase YbeY [Planctomycetota bacterium]|jgi:probable rRNA maturation factor|nr:rRNA maturation RNase YbeY [Planctomycetota bacterium]